MRLPCHFPGQQCTCRWSAATVSPRIQISDEIISSPRASEVHPRSSIQPSKLGGTASCSHTCTVERSGQMGVTIATGLSDCRGHSPGEVSTRPRVSWQRQQHSADHMPMIATSRGVHMTTASSWRACLTMRCPHLIKTSRYQQPDEVRQLAAACAHGRAGPIQHAVVERWQRGGRRRAASRPSRCATRRRPQGARQCHSSPPRPE